MVNVGAASIVINNEVGRPIQGASVDNSADFIRDDSEANALYLRSGDTAVLLLSCDLAGLVSEFTVPARNAIAQATGIPARSVIIAGTHTHSGPSLIATNYLKPIDSEYMDRLSPWLVDVAKQAVERAQPAQLAWNRGSAKLGYNRRCCWADGTHSMGGDATRPDFTGMEGPDDPAQVALFARDMDGKVIAVLHNNTGHPTSFYGRNFYSADYPGAARAHLREVFGEIPVLFLNGAFGDISFDSQLSGKKQRGTGEDKMTRTALLLAGETLRLFHEAEFRDDGVLTHAYEDVAIDVRLPEPERLEWARKTLAQVDAGGAVTPWDRLFAYGIALLQDEFGDNPTDSIPVHVVRVGDVALVTQPCELFCQFGIDIKRRSPAAITAICGIADGYGGYCPTVYGVMGGGYSGEPLCWCRLATDAGYRIVDVASKLTHQLWRE